MLFLEWFNPNYMHVRTRMIFKTKLRKNTPKIENECNNVVWTISVPLLLLLTKNPLPPLYVKTTDQPYTTLKQALASCTGEELGR